MLAPLGMYRFQTGMTLFVILFRAPDTTSRGLGPRTPCATSTTLRKVGTVLEMLAKLLAMRMA